MWASVPTGRPPKHSEIARFSANYKRLTIKLARIASNRFRLTSAGGGPAVAGSIC
jgi:hypothetical protein